jgi:hypothetical protein
MMQAHTHIMTTVETHFWGLSQPRDLSGEGLPKVEVSHGSSGYLALSYLS